VTPRKRGDLGTKGFNFGMRVVSSLRLYSGRNISNSCARKSKAPLCVHLQRLAALGRPAANAAAAPFVGKNSRPNVQYGVLLCGAGY
jgi:hypothetical protein